MLVVEYLLALQLLILALGVDGQLRFCEVSGSCKKCADRRYSYYRCSSQMECVGGEICDGGFCCPITRATIALQAESSTNAEAFPQPAPLLAQSNDVDGECPDGSNWQHKCLNNIDCDQMSFCVDGKCCPSCAKRRRLILDRLSTGDLMGKAIPQCTEDGRHYRAKQCLAGSTECWCVTPEGKKTSTTSCHLRRSESMERKAARLKALLRQPSSCTQFHAGICPDELPTGTPLMTCRCDDDCYGSKKCCSTSSGRFCAAPAAQPKTVTCHENEQFSACYSPCQPSCDDLNLPQCPPPACQAGCHCLPGFVRRDGSPRSPCIPRPSCVSFDVTTKCSDPYRQYQSCGSACPISCDTRNSPRCHERCVSGCFCRIPYILENSEDPLHSRCVLPADCPAVARSPHLLPTIAIPEGYVVPTIAGTITPRTIGPTVVPHTTRCADPLKNFLSCGSKCAAGCNANSPNGSCSLDCVPGCFCRAPYILLDANDPQSTCVLPQHCPRSTTIAATCSDPRKEWTSCGALTCARSCSNLLGICNPGQCSSGCVCREPYVLLDYFDPSSRCVLPSECERKCVDPTKEYMTCGSSCPIGCDNRNPSVCTPCRSGCYCKNGLVLLNSTNWQSSPCIRLSDCPNEETTTSSTTTSTSEEPTTTTTIAATVRAEVHESGPVSFTQSSKCPVTTLDVGGRSCNADTDCPVEQRCCRAVIASLGVNPQRCTCHDPLAIWSQCGSLCPEYCGQPAVPVCSSTCNPGCQCAPGYVRARNDVTAPCIPREACSQVPAMASLDAAHATIKELTPPADPFSPQMSAVAYLLGAVRGTFSFNQITSTKLKITGTVQGLSTGSHALVIHQRGDTSHECSRIGPALTVKNVYRGSYLGDIEVASSGAGEFSRIVNWSVSDLLGRSVAIHSLSTADLLQRSTTQLPESCATISLAE